jgi:uncharacterized membrane protein
MNIKTSLSNLHPVLKLLISVIVGGLAYSQTIQFNKEPFTRLMIGWDFLGFTYILISINIFFSTHTTKIRSIAQKQDLGHQLLYFLMLLASIICMISIALLIKTNKTFLLDKEIINLIYLSGVIVCWLMLHIIFTFHYAHMYYGDDKENKSTHRGGLNFPGSQEPDYTDFAYFSFVIGMTFQVSDVVITQKHIRRIVLLHALIAFAFNTIIVALSINAIMQDI